MDRFGESNAKQTEGEVSRKSVMIRRYVPAGTTRRTESASWSMTEKHSPSASTCTSTSGLVSMETRPTSTVRWLPCASTASTCPPDSSSDRYVIRPPAIPVYACTGPCHPTSTFNQSLRASDPQWPMQAHINPSGRQAG